LSIVALRLGVHKTWTAIAERMLLPRQAKSNEGKDDSCEHYQAYVKP